MIITARKIDKGILADKSGFRHLLVRESEYSSLLKKSKEVRYKYVIKRIVDTETLWLLSAGEDNILSISQNNDSFIPIWSSKVYGQDFCKVFGDRYYCVAISLYDFLDFLEGSSSEENMKVGVFPTIKDLMGKIVNIEFFIQSVDEEQKCY